LQRKLRFVVKDGEGVASATRSSQDLAGKFSKTLQGKSAKPAGTSDED